MCSAQQVLGSWGKKVSRYAHLHSAGAFCIRYTGIDYGVVSVA